MANGGQSGVAADFVARFAKYWTAPTPERLDALVAPNVRLVAPMTPTTRTREDGKRAFADLFELIPDLTATVHRWGATEDGVLIEFTLAGTAGGGPISWDAVDRFVLDGDGLATERVSYFDSAPVALTVARRPRVWPGFAGMQLRRLRR
ncbi:MAG: nuclear transport factor 2 family protein [Thermoleophilaceae bacterium]